MKLLSRLFPKPPTAKEVADEMQSREANAYRGRSVQGGYWNPSSGAGSSLDKMIDAKTVATVIENRELLEIWNTEYWQCQRIINVIAEDMTVRWRDWETSGNNLDIIEAIKEQEEAYHLQERMKSLIQAGRLFGTAILIIVTDDKPLEEPFSPDLMRTGSLVDLKVVDRFQLDVNRKEYEWAITEPNYGKPIWYNWHTDYKGTYRVHHSRVLRYDSEVLIDDCEHNNTAYNTDWGVSVLIPLILEVLRDEQTAAALQGNINRAGSLVLKSNVIQQQTGSKEDRGGGKSVEEVLKKINDSLTAFGLTALATDDSVEYLSPSLANWDKVLENAMRRVAASSGIPESRITGQNKSGLNNSGESDIQYYSDLIAAKQIDKMLNHLRFMDHVLLANAGLGATKPPKTFLRPYLIADKEKEAKIAKTKAETGIAMYNAGALSLNELRAIMGSDPVIGQLDPIPNGDEYNKKQVVEKKEEKPTNGQLQE